MVGFDQIMDLSCSRAELSAQMMVLLCSNSTFPAQNSNIFATTTQQLPWSLAHCSWVLADLMWLLLHFGLAFNFSTVALLAQLLFLPYCTVASLAQLLMIQHYCFISTVAFPQFAL